MYIVYYNECLKNLHVHVYNGKQEPKTQNVLHVEARGLIMNFNNCKYG